MVQRRDLSSLAVEVHDRGARMKRVLSIFFTENYLTKKIDAHIIQLDERWQKESRMKRGISLCIGILLLVGAGGVYADEVTENIQAIVIETFDALHCP